MEFSSSTVKEFLIFSQRKACLYFGNRKTRKQFLYFSKRNIFIFQETSYTLKKKIQAGKIKEHPL